MATLSVLPSVVAPAPSRRSPVWAIPVAAVALALLGLSGIWSTVLALRDLWLHDALKSIGMAAAPVSLLLILRAWRTLGWRADGSWFGLALLFATFSAAKLRESAVLLLLVAGKWSISLPPLSLVAFLYGSGVVLLFGGTRLYRAALFPILLLLLTNPVPHLFNVLVDLPLQHAAAHVARSFAQSLGQPLTPDQLRLMFTPDLGIFIAPGCNGLRGSVTMGFLALVCGYLARLRPIRHAIFAAVAVLLGYALNLLRLCGLIRFYVSALHRPALRNQGELADYLLGGVLFLAAFSLLYAALRRATRSPVPPAAAHPELAPATSPLAPRILAFLALILIFRIPSATAYVPHHPTPHPESAFPQQAGPYIRTRIWADTLPSGVVLYHWADYRNTLDRTHVLLAISPALGAHDPLVCHTARGEDPLWHGQLTLPNAAATAIPFSASLFNDGATQYLEATTLCSASSCGERSTRLRGFTLVFSQPQPVSASKQVLPVILRVETLDTTLPPEAARAQLTASLRAFIAATDLPAISQVFSP